MKILVQEGACSACLRKLILYYFSNWFYLQGNFTAQKLKYGYYRHFKSSRCPFLTIFLSNCSCKLGRCHFGQKSRFDSVADIEADYNFVSGLVIIHRLSVYVNESIQRDLNSAVRMQLLTSTCL